LWENTEGKKTGGFNAHQNTEEKRGKGGEGTHAIDKHLVVSVRRAAQEKTLNGKETQSATKSQMAHITQKKRGGNTHKCYSRNSLGGKKWGGKVCWGVKKKKKRRQRKKPNNQKLRGKKEVDLTPDPKCEKRLGAIR